MNFNDVETAPWRYVRNKQPERQDFVRSTKSASAFAKEEPSDSELVVEDV